MPVSNAQSINRWSTKTKPQSGKNPEGQSVRQRRHAVAVEVIAAVVKAAVAVLVVAVVIAKVVIIVQHLYSALTRRGPVLPGLSKMEPTWGNRYHSIDPGRCLSNLRNSFGVLVHPTRPYGTHVDVYGQ